jgi:prepilin-type N-terminal cleavage/methylation domain-containing protein
MKGKKMRNKKGFTLIELLVVIAIIALLLAILVPSLRVAKETGKRLVCQSNIKQLTQAWRSFSEENKGVLPTAMTSRVTTTEPFTWDGSTPTWVGWTSAVDNRRALEAALTLGILYPYVDTVKAYRCTNHESYNLATADPSQVKRIRSYSIVDSMNGYNFVTSKGMRYGRPIIKLTELTNSSVRMVFIDEGRETTQGWSINPDPTIASFWDVPGDQYLDGTVLSFADGHAEYWKWADQRTFAFINAAKNIADYNYAYELPAAANQSTNPDFQKIYRSIWGSGQK